MRCFVAALNTETNTFSPIPTGWSVWKQTLLSRRSDGERSGLELQPLQPVAKRAEERGWEIEVGLLAIAGPAGITPREVYESLRDELLADLATAGPVDAVCLFLHGAMVAEGYDDCEGDLIERVRQQVGPDVPVGAQLDLHAHLTRKMMDEATVLVGYKEYPHTDVIERLLELFDILVDTAEGRVVPHMSMFECRMLGLFHTTREPMRSLVQRMKDLESQDSIVNVWLAHGFPYGDVPEAGARTLVVTDAAPELGARTAEELGREFFRLREQVHSVPGTLDECLSIATKAPEGPVTIADTGDNPGGGAPCDSTFFLSAMLQRGIENAAIGPLWDPIALAVCADAGIGATLRLRIGGKMGPTSGDPVDVRATVVGLKDHVTQNIGGVEARLGACAAIRIHKEGAPTEEANRGIDIVLSEARSQAYSPTLFSDLGIDPTAKHILVVKSTQHFYAGFAPISKQILYAGDTGALQGDMKEIPFRRVDTGRLWPLVDDPFAT